MSVRKTTKIEILEELCDGCGLCIPSCAEGALAIVDGKARLLRPSLCDGLGRCLGDCPRDAIRVVDEPVGGFARPAAPAPTQPAPVRRAAWPVQLALVPPDAPFLKDCDLLVTADCVPVAFAGYRRSLLDGRRAVLACPKTDDLEFNVQKLHAIFHAAQPRSITVALMEVPCCAGLERAVRSALVLAGIERRVRIVTLAVDGSVKAEASFRVG